MNEAIKKGELSITSEFAFRLLMLAFWTQQTVLIYARAVFMRLPIIGMFANLVIPALFVVLILLSLPYMSRKIRGGDLLFYIGIVMLVIGTMFFSHDNAEYIKMDLKRILITSVPLYFIGVSYDHEKSKKDLFWASLIGVAIMFFYQYSNAQSNSEMEDNMNAAYIALPSVMYLIYWAMTQKGTLNWVIAIAAIFEMFIFGSRGPILAIIIFLALGGFASVVKSNKFWLKLVYVAVCGFVVYFFAVGDNVVQLAETLSEAFKKIGFSTRIFDYFIEGEIAYDSGRGKITKVIAEAIQAKPVLGYGFMGDRVLLDGSYAHNIFYEMLCHFGTILGPIVLFFMLGIPIYAILKTKSRENSVLLLMLFCLEFVRLMVSSSYVYEPYLYLLLGVSVSALRNRNSE